MIQVQRDGTRGFRVTGDELFEQGTGQSVDIAMLQRSFQAGDRGSAGQGIIGIKRSSSCRQLEQRVLAQGIGVVAVFVARGDLKDTLGQQIP
jgi:hypothetical protein